MTAQLETKQTDRERLETLEKIIATVEIPMRKGLAALGEILNEKLWKAGGYESEKQYLEKRWGGDVSRRLFFHKKQMAKIAAAIGGDSIPDGVREAHLACLVGYEPNLQKEILQTAQETAPGGKMTAAWVEQTARRLVDARKAAIKEELESAQRRAAEQDDDDDEDDADEAEDTDQDEEADEEDDPKPQSPKPSPTRSSGGSGSVGSASAHPIADEERIRKLEAQAKRWVTKGERIALGLNCTPEDLLERYGS